jgi:superfamily I DNA/RNA helicase/mRNA-degrading endonuclease RelE of RelBE toxin-antitoxin system
VDKVTVAVSTDFLTAMGKLQKQQKEKVITFLTKFRNNPQAPSIKYEKIENAKDGNICSVRIDGTYRAIVVRQKNNGTYLLLWVDHHDEAYQWAKNKVCRINKATSSVQVFDVVDVKTVKASEDNKNVKPPLFNNVNDTQLVQLGIPEEQILLVRSFNCETDFYAAKEKFAPDSYEALEFIANGFNPEEVLASIKENIDVTSKTKNNLVDALHTSQSQRSFVIVNNDEEMVKIMSAPLEKWRVFLHPSQKKIVTKDFNGSAKVLGGAGTGKTVVAMHRAKWLAGKSGKDRILFTTFSSSLARDILDNLRTICTIDELKQIEVVNFDSWVVNFLRKKGYEYRIIYDEELQTLWDIAIESTGVELPGINNSFFYDEWSKVVCAQEAFSKKEYLTVPRIGRGIRLDRKMRMDIWKVFEEYKTLLNEEKVRDVELAMFECKALVKEPLYRYIIVDEGQDFNSSAFRLIRKIAGNQKPNDIFIVGDTHQRIYKYHTVLSRCGINIKGRSKYLKINYRTTEEIRKTAFGILNGEKFDDMDDCYDNGEITQSLTHGELPFIKNFITQEEEIKYLIKTIKNLEEEKVILKDICIIARTNKLVEEYRKSLSMNGLTAYKIAGSRLDDRQHDGVRLATMHRVKGLEFDYVFLVSANSNVLPLKAALNSTDNISKKQAELAEKCLIYVAMTRAKKATFVTSYGKQSKFIN